MSLDIQNLLKEFSRQVAGNSIEIYNEFSLQHELGIFLRHNHPEFRVSFERPVGFFFPNAGPFKKKEIDICITSPDREHLFAAIELKYPRNGQHPEQMFSFCKDILFAEQLKLAGFTTAAVAIFAEDRLFYQGAGEGIYKFFRAGHPLTGQIVKPTGARDDEVLISGKYTITWNTVANDLRYTVISV